MCFYLGNTWFGGLNILSRHHCLMGCICRVFIANLWVRASIDEWLYLCGFAFLQVFYSGFPLIWANLEPIWSISIHFPNFPQIWEKFWTLSNHSFLKYGKGMNIINTSFPLLLYFWIGGLGFRCMSISSKHWVASIYRSFDLTIHAFWMWDRGQHFDCVFL